MSQFVTVKALKPLDVRNFQFNEKLPPSEANPVSVPVAAGEEFQLPAEHVAFNVTVGNIAPPAADAATP